ncbi:MAG: hypothetical protein KAQ85_05855 [Thermodesulfovibrionia bacterium]|nr:hypothetical protein [Thermodesulfovibrionia bacterium]
MLKRISIDDIVAENSRFSLRDYIFEKNLHEKQLMHSLEHMGIVSPVTLYKDNRGLLHLIDGKKRILYAKKKKINTADAIVLPEATPLTEIISMIFYDKKNEINESTINKIQFICFALSTGAPEAWILESLCIPLAFKPHSDFLQECERANNLPEELKLFCHEKRFSLKQILNLTCYPENLLMKLIIWKSVLHLTASTLDEIASGLRDYLKSQHKTIDDLLSEPEVHGIIRSSLSPRDRTEQLRHFIYKKRFPILSEANARIKKKVERLNLPEAVTIKWDKTLENRNVDITIHIQDTKKWTELLDILNSNKMRYAIKNILEEL